MIFANRAGMEVALGRALSRHIGYTTAAYGLDRILSVLVFFRDRPSAFKEEIVSFLADRDHDRHHDAHEPISQDYLSDIVTFARAFGIIQQTSSRDLRLQKYAPTEQGRSLLAAQALGDAAFAKFYVARAVFLADADSLVALLSYYNAPPHEPALSFYVNFFLRIRTQRFEWVRRAFSEPILFERIAGHLAWLESAKRGRGEPRIEPFSQNTARHHVTPRKGWLEAFGMFERDGDRLTDFGRKALQSLGGANDYFWLGPPRGVQEALRIAPDLRLPGPFEDEFSFTGDQRQATEKENRALAVDVAAVMERAFPYAKLIHAAQASLLLPIEFVIYRSFADAITYDTNVVLDEVFSANRDTLDRLSALKGNIGFYRVR